MLVRQDGGAVLTLAPLERPASDRLVEAILDGPAATSVTHTIWRLALGNPLFTREVTVNGHADGAITFSTTGWELDGPLGTSVVLRTAVEHRLRSIGDDGARS